MLRLLLALGLLLILPASGLAQDYNRIAETQSNVPAYFFHARPGEAITEVYVMGTVGAPGLYYVAQGTDLEQLLALTGGASTGAIDARDSVSVTIRLFRPEGEQRRLVYEEAMADFVRQTQAPPTLRSGDVVEVGTLLYPYEPPERRTPFWRDALSVVTTLGSLALLVLRIVE